MTGGTGVLPATFIYALPFGALISPTDAVAVLGIVKTAGGPRDLETNISGEARFNDGPAVVVFLTILGVAISQDTPTLTGGGTFFIREGLGGTALGLLLGWVTYRLLNSVDSYKVEVLVTLALVAGGYALALAPGVSGAHRHHRRRPADRQSGPATRHVRNSPDLSGRFLGVDR